MDIYVARQPIFDRNKEVYAYELLFRSGPENYFPDVDPDKATSSLIDTSVFSVGLENLVGDKMAFINLTRNSLLDGLVSFLPKTNIVLEILETVEPDKEVVSACGELHEQGYQIALDDFVYRPEFEPLLELADYVKVDFLASGTKDRQLYAKHFAPRGISLLAEKVENYEEFQGAVSMDYSFFQGYFFCKPEMITAKRLPEYKMNYLLLLKELNKPDLDFSELEQIIKHDVSLSMKLLKLLNSAAMGLRREVSSIKHALVLLGEKPLKKWASLLAFASLAEDKPDELILTCLIRARFCELLSIAAGMKEKSLDLFLTGMLSAIDAVMDKPLDQMLNELSVSEEITETLKGQETKFSNIFQLALAFEQADWKSIEQLGQNIRNNGKTIPQLYREALMWSTEIQADNA